MPLKQMKIVGSIGRWTAEADGTTLPVLHRKWWTVKSGEYFDPMATLKPGDSGKYADLVTRLEAGELAIIQKDIVIGSNELRRAGYAGVYRYSDFQQNDDGSIFLKIVGRIAEPRK